MNLENIINTGKRFLSTSLLVGALAVSPFLGGCDKGTDETQETSRKNTEVVERNVSKEEMKRYFPLAVGNKWTYERTIMKGRNPKHRYVFTVLQDHPFGHREKGDRILMIGISPEINSRIETYTVVDNEGKNFEIEGSVKGKDKDAQGFWPYELMSLDKLIWRINKWGNNFVFHEIREGGELGCKVRCSEMIGTLNTSGSYKINISPKGSYHKKVMGKKAGEIKVPAGVFDNTIKNTFDYVAGVEFEDTKIIRYFAKDVGLVKEAQFDSDKKMIYKLELIDYNVK